MSTKTKEAASLWADVEREPASEALAGLEYVEGELPADQLAVPESAECSALTESMLHDLLSHIVR
jgi:hypothetical protein